MKNVLITGANQGIGFEVARQLEALGHNVIIGSRDLNKGQNALDKLLEAGAKNVTLVQLDVTDLNSIQTAVGNLQKRITQLDILINNAAISGDNAQEIHAIELDKLRQLFETNFFGAIQSTQAFLPLLSKSTLPVIVNVSSELGSLSTHLKDERSNYLRYDAYSATKTALNALTVLMAGQFRGTSFKINSVTPGYTATNLNNYQGAKSPAEAANVIVRYATLDAQGPTGGFFGQEGRIDW
ncbi:SDR family NAD(P)-dependent oxidoreductase [Arachidicoccus ginsenosidivorans]|uniref:SDR family NAD(P)-dependent oxidoreductase n=1 Tax=Arachidicoccus ginsenosidivorans TaxID=496057 RepID=A0A5B8VKR1_9BACT|nr:SDR family NAD(P)-dependent oxidoreductase [Arachidicoccus ginsenosidivorans]QEC71555.1 SDR family NAD(P)-dependent oxidoreductase [Arachidicoccus ginsenosidivorans]